MRLRSLLASGLLAATLALASVGAAAQDAYRAPGPWLDDSAQPFQLDTLRQRMTVLTMAYGACRRICSTSLRVMQQVQVLADARHLDLNFVVIGLDPDEDKPADWAAFRADRKLARPNWYFLSGDAAATRGIAQRLGVHYWKYGEHTMHDFKIMLLTPEGRTLRSSAAFDDDPSLLLP